MIFCWRNITLVEEKSSFCIGRGKILFQCLRKYYFSCWGNAEKVLYWEKSPIKKKAKRMLEKCRENAKRKKRKCKKNVGETPRKFPSCIGLGKKGGKQFRSRLHISRPAQSVEQQSVFFPPCNN